MSKVPWLQRTGFLTHLAGLLDKEVKSSYQLTRPDDDDIKLARICEAAESVLSKFHGGASSTAQGFRYRKNPSTLSKYFATFRQLLAYYFRIVRRADLSLIHI